MRDSDLGKKTEAQFALHHALGGFDSFHLENHVRQDARSAKQPLAERPIARSSVVKNEWHGFNFLERQRFLARRRVRGMTHQDERIVPQRHGLYPRLIERTGYA